MRMIRHIPAQSIEPYLARLGLASNREPSRELLANLQNQHLQQVPFENLDVVWGNPIRLGLDELYDKIVNRWRGGFCYELNGLFAWLLGSLGYAVDLLSARVYSEERRDFGPEFDHMAICVHLEHPYLVDVGFGDSFRQPLLLPDGRTEDVSGQYRLLTLRPGSDELELQHREDGLWKPQHRFTLRPRKLADFDEMCNYHQSSPRSSFTQGPVCTRATPDGRITLTQNELILTRDSDIKKTPVHNQEHFKRLLGEYFSISTPVDHPP
jgi:N-hydroxyarylamine O-acetyltransferase